MNGFPFENYNEPYSLEAEQAVLGSVLIDPPCLPAVMEILKTEHFYIPQHREIYGAIVTLDAVSSRIDPLIVLEELKRSGAYGDADGKNYLAQLAQAVPSAANVAAYAKIVREKFFVRQLMTASRAILHDCAEDAESADTILDAAEQRIYDIRRGRTVAGPARLSEVLSNTVIENLKLLQSPDRKKYLGIPTGFSKLDKCMTGLNRSDLILIGARPAVGKTSFVLNIARNVSVVSGQKVVFFSLEMSKEQLAQRLLATEARVESTKLRTGELSSEDWERITEATSSLHDAELYLDDSTNITVPEMKARVRRMRDVKCVFIDYLQLMQGVRRVDSRAQEVAELTRGLKLMAKDLDIPVVVCSQLNRESVAGRGTSRKPTMAELRESGSIEQDADIVLLLYRQTERNEKNEEVFSDENEATIIIDKNRHGPTGEIILNWNKNITLFTTPERNLDE